MHIVMANNNINYMVGFSYNNGVYYRDYNNADYTVPKLKPRDRDTHPISSPDKQVWCDHIKSKHDGGKTGIFISRKLIYKQEYVDYPPDDKYYDNKGISQARIHSLKLNENIRTSVYYLMKL